MDGREVRWWKRWKDGTSSMSAAEMGRMYTDLRMMFRSTATLWKSTWKDLTQCMKFTKGQWGRTMVQDAKNPRCRKSWCNQIWSPNRLCLKSANVVPKPSWSNKHLEKRPASPTLFITWRPTNLELNCRCSTGKSMKVGLAYLLIYSCFVNFSCFCSFCQGIKTKALDELGRTKSSTNDFVNY